MTGRRKTDDRNQCDITAIGATSGPSPSGVPSGALNRPKAVYPGTLVPWVAYRPPALTVRLPRLPSVTPCGRAVTRSLIGALCIPGRPRGRLRRAAAAPADSQIGWHTMTHDHTARRQDTAAILSLTRPPSDTHTHTQTDTPHSICNASLPVAPSRHH